MGLFSWRAYAITILAIISLFCLCSEAETFTAFAVSKVIGAFFALVTYLLGKKWSNLKL